jgi:hypothetical protein
LKPFSPTVHSTTLLKSTPQFSCDAQSQALLTAAPYYYIIRLKLNLVHRHIQKIQGPLSLGHAHHRNRRGFIVGFAKGGETSAAPSV